MLLNNRLYHIFIFALLFLGAFSLRAQNFIGFQTSNYAGIYGLHTQPASIADNRFLFDINVNGFSSTYWNNYISSKVASEVPNLQNWSDTKIFTLRPKDKNKNYRYQNTEVVNPLSFMLTTSPKSAIAFVWRSRYFDNMDNMNKDMILNTERKNLNPLFWNKEIDASKTRITNAFFDEYAFTYGRVLKDSGEHFLKMGATFKMLQTFTAEYVYANSLVVNYKNDTTVALKSVNVEGGFGNNLPPNGEVRQTTLLTDRFKDWKSELVNHLSLFGDKTMPTGFGGDIGFVYEYRPDFKDYCYVCEGKPKNMRFTDKYKFKLAASVLDMGFLTVRKNTYNLKFEGNNVDSAYFKFSKMNNLSGPLVFLNDNVNTEVDTTKVYRLLLPTAITLMADYKISKKISVGALYYGAFKRKNSPRAIHGMSNFSIIPRYVLAKVKRVNGREIVNPYGELSIPISLDQNFEPQVGMGIRVTVPKVPIQLMIGSNNMLGLRIKKQTKGMDIHLALSLPLAFQNNDKDFDCVKNRKDKCIETPGLKKFAGCPDTDGDLVPDNIDECVIVPGKVNLNGCPDRDDDRIPDGKDICPDVKGIAKYNGCPDTDGDQIPDPEDNCPNEKGKKELRGCPDTDNDNITDKDDECPKEKGKKELKGCPDTDNDNISDKEDKCPKDKGSLSANGCPDADEDGVADKEDKCPKDKGTPKANGCPDADEDGITDKDDKCPNEAGTKADKGCPKDSLIATTPSNPDVNSPTPLKPNDMDGDGVLDKDDKCPNQYGLEKGCPPKSETPAFIQHAFDEIEFDVNKSDIRPQYFDLLDGLAFYLRLNPDLRLILRGNTDSDADESYNEALGKRRAEAVMQYLISHEVAKERFKIETYGERKPKTENDSQEGKQRNRRVEVSIWESWE